MASTPSGSVRVLATRTKPTNLRGELREETPSVGEALSLARSEARPLSRSSPFGPEGLRAAATKRPAP